MCCALCFWQSWVNWSCCWTPRDSRLLARKEGGLGGMWLEVCWEGQWRIWGGGRGLDWGSRLDSGLVGSRKEPVPVGPQPRSLQAPRRTMEAGRWPLTASPRPVPCSPALGWQEELELYCHPGKNSNQEPPFRCVDEVVSLFSRGVFNDFVIKEVKIQELCPGQDNLCQCDQIWPDTPSTSRRLCAPALCQLNAQRQWTTSINKSVWMTNLLQKILAAGWLIKATLKHQWAQINL